MGIHLVIPVYNEAANIVPTLDAIRDHVRTPFDVTIVYDFAEDSTLPVVNDYAARHPENRFKLLHNDLGKGVVNAIRKGLQSIEEGAAVVLMADLSDDYRIIDRMAALIDEGYDLVCGSRYCRGGQQIGGPWLKGQMSRMAGLSLHFLTGIPTRDVTNSFKMYKASLLQGLTLESQGGFEIGMEILVKAFIAGRRIIEVPSVWRDRPAGESRFRLLAWLPHYLKWYWLAVRWRLSRSLGN